MQMPAAAFVACLISCCTPACQQAKSDNEPMTNGFGAGTAGTNGETTANGASAGAPAGGALSNGDSGAGFGAAAGEVASAGGGEIAGGAGGAASNSQAGATGAAGDLQAGGAASQGIGCASAAFCESFEKVPRGAPPNPAIWSRTSNDLVVDATDAALGTKQALHVPALVNGFKYIREKVTIDQLGKSFYGRVFFRIDRRPTEKPKSLFHWTVLSADELENYQAGKLIRIGGHIEADLSNWLRFNFQTHNDPGETGLDDRTATLDTKRWYCLEFYYSLPEQEARVWLDGAERPKLHWLKSVQGYTFPASLSYMSFGWAEAHGIASPWEVWIDEIALDRQRIGCQ